MNMKRTKAAICAGIGLTSIAAVASADVTVDPFGGTLQNTAAIGIYNFGVTVYENVDSESSSTGVDWSSSVGFIRDAGSGFNASISSEGAWNYNPSNPGPAGSVTEMSVSSLTTLDVSTTTQNTEEYLNAGMATSLYVDIDADTEWSFSGVFDGTSVSSGVGDYRVGWSVQVVDLDTGPFGTLLADFRHYESSGTVDFQDVVDESGVLGAGHYTFIVNTIVAAEYFEQGGQAGSSTQSIRLTDGLFQFREIPSPGTAPLLAVGLPLAVRRRRSTNSTR